MKYQRQHLAAGFAVMMLFGTACATGKPSPPPVDPVKEQIIILQKQLLDLQNIQNETRRKLDEQTNLMDSLSSRLKVLEEHRTAQRISQVEQQQNAEPSISPDKTKSAHSTGKKKKKKKKKMKPVRRQEQ